MENANDCRMSTIDGTDYSAFGTAVWTDIRDVHQDQVTVHGRGDLVRGDEDVACEFGFQLAQRFGIGDDEAESVAVHAETSGDEVFVGGGLRKLITVGVDCNQLAAFDQLLEMSLQFAPLLPVQAQFADQLFVSGLAFGLAGDVGEDGVVGEHERKLLASGCRFWRSAFRITQRPLRLPFRRT